MLAGRIKCGSFGSYGTNGYSATFLLTHWFISQQSAVALLRIVTPGAEFCDVTLYDVQRATRGFILKITVLLDYSR